MPYTEIRYTLQSINRIDVRKELIALFLKEKAGTGNGDKTSKYGYIVEEFQKYKIILQRPARFNKGFDFTVHVSGLLFLSNSQTKEIDYPPHGSIISILRKMKETLDTSQYNKIAYSIKQIFSNNTFDPQLTANLLFEDHHKQKHSISIILLALKWLFIEQDITYWNWSGRYMLRNALKDYQLICEE